MSSRRWLLKFTRLSFTSEKKQNKSHIFHVLLFIAVCFYIQLRANPKGMPPRSVNVLHFYLKPRGVGRCRRLSFPRHAGRRRTGRNWGNLAPANPDESQIRCIINASYSQWSLLSISISLLFRHLVSCENNPQTQIIVFSTTAAR